MKSKVSRIAAVLGVLAAVGAMAAPAGAASRGGVVSPPWSQVCADRFGIACVPTPGPYAA
jgi:hypothetical protein